jgi:hypothetical protein
MEFGDYPGPDGQAPWHGFRCVGAATVHGIDKALLASPRTVPSELLTGISALLWRMHLLGVGVGDRWEVVADKWDKVGPMHDHAFDAWLAMMAFVGARREVSQRQTLITLKVTSFGAGRGAYFAKAFGMPAAQGILAFGAGRYAETVDLLGPLCRNPHPSCPGQTHRNLVEHTLVEAALRSGQNAFADSLVTERASRRPRKTPKKPSGPQTSSHSLRV